jgi:hypothetical protein
MFTDDVRGCSQFSLRDYNHWPYATLDKLYALLETVQGSLAQ